MKIALLFLFALAGFVSSQEALQVVEDSAVHHVSSKADFEAQLETAGDKLVVVDFYASWSKESKIIAPKIEQMAKQYKGEVVFLKVEINEIRELIAEYEIKGVPTFVFIINKKVIERVHGGNEDQVKWTIEQLKESDTREIYQRTAAAKKACVKLGKIFELKDYQWRSMNIADGCEGFIEALTQLVEKLAEGGHDRSRKSTTNDVSEF